MDKKGKKLVKVTNKAIKENALDSKTRKEVKLQQTCVRLYVILKKTGRIQKS